MGGLRRHFHHWPGLHLVDCGTLISVGRLYGRVAEAVFGLSRLESCQINSSAELVALYRSHRPANASVMLVLAACEQLLWEDAKSLWTLLHLRHVIVLIFVFDYGIDLAATIPCWISDSDDFI